MHVDRRTDKLRQGKTQMKMPDDADWGWRPDVFATRLGQMNSVVKSARHDVGTSIAVHHNDTDPELIIRHFKNMGVDDLAPFGLSVETYEFKGSFLSLAIDLPSEAATGLTKTTFLKGKANCHWITQCRIRAVERKAWPKCRRVAAGNPTWCEPPLPRV